MDTTLNQINVRLAIAHMRLAGGRATHASEDLLGWRARLEDAASALFEAWREGEGEECWAHRVGWDELHEQSREPFRQLVLVVLDRLAR